jgi:hypothetical protein
VKDSGLRPRPVAALIVEDNIIIKVVVVDKSCKTVGVWRLKKTKF